MAHHQHHQNAAVGQERTDNVGTLGKGEPLVGGDEGRKHAEGQGKGQVDHQHRQDTFQRIQLGGGKLLTEQPGQKASCQRQTDGQGHQSQCQIHHQESAGAAVCGVLFALGPIFYIKPHQGLAKAQIQHGEKGDDRRGHRINAVLALAQVVQHDGGINDTDAHIEQQLHIGKQGAGPFLISHTGSFPRK